MASSGTSPRFLSGARAAFIAIVFAAYAAGLIYAAQRWDVPRITGRAWAFLSLALVLELVAKLMFATLFRVGLRVVGHQVSWRAGLAAAMTGSAVARLLPGGGALTPSTMALTVKNEESEAAGAAVRVTMLTYAGLLIMTGLGLIWIATEGPHPLLFAGAIVLGVSLTAAGLVVMAGAASLDRLIRVFPARLRSYLAPTAAGGRVTLAEAALVALRVSSEAAVLWAARQRSESC